MATLAVLAGVIAGVYAQAAGATDSPPVARDRPEIVAEQPAAKTYRIAVIGDSTTSGSDFGGRGPQGWPELVWGDLRSQQLLVAPDVSGRGGSGYVRRGLEATVFPEEAARVISPHDDLIVFFGSTNDGAESLDEVASAARSAYEEARRIAPQAALLVIGPSWPRPDVPEQLLGIRNVLRDEAQRVGGTFVDPLSQGWFWDGPPELIGGDNVHPTDAGHVYLAQHIEPLIKQALGI
ncbi:SGNH/GDSL hydrolase family protein [Mycobacterium sp. JS623]|uniref:SGNH/GDSL hydrolase family protein n=1 Tax=Mycobacterium sp. JS623 TaxID=212767 RepID=UPI000686BA8B|nr:SGNH/GDSL hydrolase family protein [Mycobacterium sp. JS623]